MADVILSGRLIGRPALQSVCFPTNFFIDSPLLSGLSRYSFGDERGASWIQGNALPGKAGHFLFAPCKAPITALFARCGLSNNKKKSRGAGHVDSRPNETQEPYLKHVLLVEDDRFVQRVISLMAKKLGCSLVLADSVASGWREAQKARFDLILLDWDLPDGTGGEVIRRIRTYPYYSRNQRTPIVVQSASPDAVRLDLAWIYYPTVIHPGKITGIETLRQILRRWSA